MVKVIWTSNARNDLKSIFDYISEDSNFYAKRFIDKIIKKVDVLENYPNLGRVVPEFQNPHLRELIEGNYRIVYRILKDQVQILRVHHSSKEIK